MRAVVHRLYISPGHNFFGRQSVPAGDHPTEEVNHISCDAGLGLKGDRFHGYRPDYKGQVTFFSWETFEAVRREFVVPALSPGAFRRNIVVAGLDLNTLIGQRFTLGGVAFEGTGEARPCHWMNHAVAPGAEEWLKGRGGLRARITSNGTLVLGAAELVMLEKTAKPGQSAGFVGKRAVELGFERGV